MRGGHAQARERERAEHYNSIKSHSTWLRLCLCCAAVPPQTVPLLDGAHTSPLAAGLLYQLSLCDEACTAFCFCPGGLPRLLDSILRALGGPSSSNTGGVVVVGWWGGHMHAQCNVMFLRCSTDT